jgi:hypothetical protein
VRTPKRAVERVPAAVEVRVVGLVPAEALQRVGRVEDRPVVAVRGTGGLAVQGSECPRQTKLGQRVVP